ncbi:MAG TPA: hypothetical protein VLO07_08275 [Thermoanaerobaculia bacterium]|nr:hypothetical protein [Thermoanaerobaculia bacterium]
MRLRTSHYWRREARTKRPQRFAGIACDAEGTVGKLSTEAQPALSWFDRVIAFLTTPFKFLGISGWKETGCEADAVGRPVRNAQHSTDGFWTMDVRLEAFRIATTSADPRPDKFIRLEVEPGTKAHDVCASSCVIKDMELAFAGAVVVDTDGPFLEVHPEDDFRIVGTRSASS